jgi:hypothetical protein
MFGATAQNWFYFLQASYFFNIIKDKNVNGVPSQFLLGCLLLNI